MIKKVCILLLLISLSTVPVMAQVGGEMDGVSDFAPKKGEWQFSVVLGNGSFFKQHEGMNYLLSDINPTSVGLPGEGLDNQSGDPAMYLNLGGIGENSIMNVIGIETKYFLSEKLSVKAMFSMNISLTPKKDFVEGDLSVPTIPIPSYKYVEARTSNSWMLSVGSDYYFQTKNNRIHPYIGAIAGFQMSKLTTSLPYTGEVIADGDENIPLEMYVAGKRTGSIWAAQGGIVAGIDFSLAKGLSLGFEVQPATYQYSQIQIKPAGMNTYGVENHSIKLFNLPSIKLGMRF